MTLSTGPDGIDVSGYGWTNQSSTFQSNKSLESYGPATAAVAATQAAPVNTLTWTGSSSPTSVALTGGQFYLVSLAGSTTGTVAAAVTESLGAINANAGNALYSATTTYRAATLGTQLASVTSSSTFGTSTLSADLVWVGLH
jgi:hypothetical protein